MLRLAVIGVGWAGRRQAEAVREIAGQVCVEGLVDCDAEHLDEQARQLGIGKTYTDYHEALADPAVEAVSICLPHALHHPVALAAAAAGKHVLCEKPLALTVQEGREMLRAAAEHGVRLYVAESAVYAPLPKMLRSMVRRGEYLGEMTAAVYVRGFRGLDYGYPGRRAWLADPQRGGSGTWLLHGIHTVAELRYIFGEVASVFVQEHKTRAFVRPDVEGTLSVLLRLANGCSVHLIQTPETRVKGRAGGYTIYGTQGVLRAYGDTVEVLGDDPATSPVLSCPHQPLSNYAEEILAFARYVQSGTPGPTTGQSELRSLAIVEAGYESMKTGQPVDLQKRYPDLFEAR